MATLVDYQVYPEEYFSGADVSVYFGDVWVDEIVSINFTLMEYVQPLFGYNSYTYDAVARGSRIIQGNFRINFKEAYYLHRIIRTQNLIKGTQRLWETYSPDRLSAEQVIGLTAALNGTEAYKDQIKKFLSSQDSKKDILMAAAAFQKTVWEAPSALKGPKNEYFSTPDISTSDAPYFSTPVYDKQNNMIGKKPMDGFSIVIVYGSVLHPLSSSSTNMEFVDKYLVPSSTVHTLVGVQLMSVSQVITPSGEPVYEDYQFIARDLDSKVG